MSEIKSEKRFNCPSCGYPLPVYFKYSKLVKCPSCGSNVFLEDDAVKLMGESSILSKEPSLLSLHTPIEVEGVEYTPIGHIRYKTGIYAWDEWWCISGKGGYWISVDDGDYILEKEIEYSLPTKNPDDFTLGREFGEWMVTEVGEGECEGFEGEIPDLILPGKKYRYAHLSKSDGSMMTVEFDEEGAYLFIGKWIDPYEIKVSR